MVMVVIFLQVEMFIGDQNGVIHIWDLRTDNNEQLVCQLFARQVQIILCWLCMCHSICGSNTVVSNYLLVTSCIIFSSIIRNCLLLCFTQCRNKFVIKEFYYYSFYYYFIMHLFCSTLCQMMVVSDCG